MKSRKLVHGMGERKLGGHGISSDGILVLKTTLQIGIFMCILLACFTLSFFHDSGILPFLLEYRSGRPGRNASVHLPNHDDDPEMRSPNDNEFQWVHFLSKEVARHLAPESSINYIKRVSGAHINGTLLDTESTFTSENGNVAIHKNGADQKITVGDQQIEPRIQTVNGMDSLNFTSICTKREGDVQVNGMQYSETGSLGIAVLGEGSNNEGFWCDRHHKRTDVCFMHGNVHIFTGNSSSVVLHLSSSPETEKCSHVEWNRPYTRKWEATTMASVQPVSLHILGSRNSSHVRCNFNHSTPALLFSSGGFTGNPYHDFQDVLIPLFITSQHLKGEVVFIVTDMREWWVARYILLIQQLSHYPVVDFKVDTGVHCFPEVIVGLYIHKEFGIDPSKMPHHETMKDFQKMLNRAFSRVGTLPDKVPSLRQSKPTSQAVTMGNQLQQSRSRKLQLLIVARTGNRIVLNQAQVIRLSEQLGFEVKVVTPSDKVDLRTLYSLFHDSQVVVGVHGAGLAHTIFMERRAVFIQIVPLGTDWPSHNYYAGPSVRELGLQYLEYNIKPEESTLSDRYGLNHPIVRNPARFVAKGWETQKEIYLSNQDVRLSLKRFQKMLLDAKRRALSAFPR